MGNKKQTVDLLHAIANLMQVTIPCSDDSSAGIIDISKKEQTIWTEDEMKLLREYALTLIKKNL